MRVLISRFAADERGATAAEYGMIVVVLTLTLLVAWQTTGTALNDMLQTISLVLNG